MKLEEKKHRVVIGLEREAQSKYEKDSLIKIDLFKRAISFSEQYVTIEDKTSFSNNLIAYFQNQISEKYRHEFSPSIRIEKIMDQLDIDYSILERLQSEYEALPVNINVDKLEIIKIDFRIYTNNQEQFERYQKLKSFCASLDEIKKLGFIQDGEILKAVRGLLVMDWSSDPNILVPNPSFILS